MASKEPVFLMGDHGTAVIEVVGGEHKTDFQCDGVPMGILLSNSTEGIGDKHLPQVKKEGNKVCVEIGKIPHPMEADHNIQWIHLQTEKGSQRRNLEPGKTAKVEFIVAEDDKAIAVYSYCNLHGYWKTEV